MYVFDCVFVSVFGFVFEYVFDCVPVLLSSCLPDSSLLVFCPPLPPLQKRMNMLELAVLPQLEKRERESTQAAAGYVCDIVCSLLFLFRSPLLFFLSLCHSVFPPSCNCCPLPLLLEKNGHVRGEESTEPGKGKDPSHVEDHTVKRCKTTL